MDKTPGQLAEDRYNEAQDYAKLGSLLAKIQDEKAKAYPEIREACKSIAESDRIWEMTEFGLQEKKLKIQMKVKEKKMSAIKTLLDVANNEAFNQY